jgi:elongation factor G
MLRNVVFVAHSGAGKTTLSEVMLFKTGAINRLGTLEEGNTTSDYDPEEIKRKISINLSLIPLSWRELSINFIDTPGYADFVGEMKAGIRVADGAVVVVCAASGVEVGTEQAWEYTKDLPRLIFINKMERENANFNRAVGEIQGSLGKRCVPFQIPLGLEAGFRGVVDLISMKAYGKEGEIELPGDVLAEASSFREKLIEAIAESSDEVMVKYLEGEELSSEELRSSLRKGVKEKSIVPILVGSALSDIGISSLMDALVDLLPSPLEKKLSTLEGDIETEAQGPLAVLAFKTILDPYVGKLTYLRVWSGVLSSNSQVWNASKGSMEKIGQLVTLRGKKEESVSELNVGDMGAVVKLESTTVGDTLCAKEHPVTLPGIEFPPPIFSVALQPKTKSDVDKLSNILPKIMEEDPTLTLTREQDTGEIILNGRGDSHIGVVVGRMRQRFGVEVEVNTPKVPYRETIAIPVKSEYKHKKQSGGHGQYGHVLLELEPLPRGSENEFMEKVVGGSVPKNYISAVEKGVVEALKEGVLAGYPVADIRVSLYDGSSHPVDSSDIAFKIAAEKAVKKGLSEGKPIFIEPIMHLEVISPDTFTGDIVGDLNTKRAHILGISPHDNFQTIGAYVPLVEVLRYAIDLRSITQGKGSFTMEFDHYQEVPLHIAPKIIEGGKA